jgi:hypothetical protein
MHSDMGHGMGFGSLDPSIHRDRWRGDHGADAVSEK